VIHASGAPAAGTTPPPGGAARAAVTRGVGLAAAAAAQHVTGRIVVLLGVRRADRRFPAHPWLAPVA
jgi:hypothetical protein